MDDARGRDILFGGAGHDVLVSESGADMRVAGGNADVFVYKGTTGSASIIDFEDGLDLIDHSGMNASDDMSDVAISDISSTAAIVTPTNTTRNSTTIEVS